MKELFQIKESKDIKGLEYLTFKALPFNENMTSFALYILNIPRALLILEDEEIKSKIVSIYVEPEFRRAKLGSELLKAAQDKASKPLYIEYSNNDILEKFFLYNKWQKPYDSSIFASLSIDKILDSKFFFKERALPLNFVIEYIEKENFDKNFKDKIDSYLNPSLLINPIILSLKFDGKVVGWLTTISYENYKAIEYRQFFIKNDFKGYGPFLIFEALKNHPKDFKGFFKFKIKNVEMMQFFERYLKRYSEKIKVMRYLTNKRFE